MQQTPPSKILSQTKPKRYSHPHVQQSPSTIVLTNQKFSNKIIHLNQEACNFIHERQYSSAISSLQEAEKLLEYAANSGKQIDRSWIIVTLSNQACAHQKAWSLDDCLDYLEGVIINLEKWLDEINWEQDLNTQTGRNKLCRNLNLKLLLALSRVQFSALTSQVSVQDQALVSAHEALNDFRKLVREICRFEKHQASRNSQLTTNLSRLIEKSSTNSFNTSSLTKQVKSSLYELQNQRFFLAFDSSQISEFSISNVLQLVPRKITEFKQNIHQLDWFISQAGLTHIALYISSCYFVISTQLRILHENEAENILNKSSVEFSLENASDYFFDELQTSKKKIAVNYHLVAIKIATSFVLCETNFLKHILQSFRNNYQIDLDNALTQRSDRSSKNIIIMQQNMLQKSTDNLKLINSPKCKRINSKLESNLKENKENLNMKVEYNIHSQEQFIENDNEKKSSNQVPQNNNPTKKVDMKLQSPKISFFTISSPKRDPKQRMFRKKSNGSSKSNKNIVKKMRTKKSRQTTPQQHYLNPNSRNKSFTSNKNHKSREKQKITSKEYFTMQSRMTEYKSKKTTKVVSPKLKEENPRKKNTSKNKIKVKEQIKKYYM